MIDKPLRPEEPASTVLDWLVWCAPAVDAVFQVRFRVCKVPPENRSPAEKISGSLSQRNTQVTGGIVGEFETLSGPVISGGDARGGIIDSLQDIVDGVGGSVVIDLDAIDRNSPLPEPPSVMGVERLAELSALLKLMPPRAEVLVTVF